MKKILQAITQSIEAHPPDYCNYDSLLDMLYWQYTETNSIDNEKIRGHFDTLRARIPLSRTEYDEIMYTICDLCLEHGRLAFIEGLRLGVVLMQELNIKESRA